MHRITIALALVLTLAPPLAAEAGPYRCHGRPVTILATGPATVGTAGPDVILVRADWAGWKNVTVDALGGNDTVCVWGASSEVHGGAGNDYIESRNPGGKTSGFKNRLFGDGGDDILLLGDGTGADRADGGTGTDFCSQSNSPGKSQAKFANCEIVRTVEWHT